MNPLNYYKYTTGFLVILNISLVSFFFITKPKHPPESNQHQFLKKALDELKLNKEQNITFQNLVNAHQTQMRNLVNDQKAILTPYFNTLLDSSKFVIADSLLTKVQTLERNKIELTYKHFQDVQSILEEDQRSRFKAFMNNTLGRILLNENKNPAPPIHDEHKRLKN